MLKKTLNRLSDKPSKKEKKGLAFFIDILISHPEEVSIESFSLERQRYVLKLSIGCITNRTRCVATSSPPKIVGHKRKDFNSTVCCALSVIEVNYLSTLAQYECLYKWSLH